MHLTEYHLDLVTQALRALLPLKHPADAVLRKFFQEQRTGSRERALISETAFGILRHRMFLEHACQPTEAARATPRRMALAYWIRFGGHNLRELEPLLRKDEATWLGTVKAIPIESLPLATQAELPEWVIEKLRTTMTDKEILALGRAMQNPAPLDLRVNTFLSSRNEALEQLAADGMEVSATPWSPIGIRLRGKPALNKHPLFLSGKVEVQDEGSQLLGFLLAPKRNDMVVDFCAGAGGKTLMLGAMMNSQGRLYAFDVSEKRLSNLKTRLKRSGLSNLHPQLIAHENDQKIKRLAGKIDRVLVDAPCSGMGTLRRNPDLKFRQSPQSVAELTQKQASILAAASRLVKPGGRLVYATCSLLQEENRGIVDAFLADHPGFSLRPANETLAQQLIALDTGDYLQLSPLQHGTDGFFAAVMERAA
jgi:16S rRNA (cytosine967-C5)-methyltransferase